MSTRSWPYAPRPCSLGSLGGHSGSYPPRRLLRGLDEVPRGLAHVSAEQAVEVVYDEGADHLWRLGLGSGLGLGLGLGLGIGLGLGLDHLWRWATCGGVREGLGLG